MSDYLKVVYDDKLRPYTDYPGKLARLLFEKYGMQAGQTLLEPGCGRGEILKCFRDFGMQVKGSDLSPETAALLRAFYEGSASRAQAGRLDAEPGPRLGSQLPQIL
jgi:2-polyprenyl-3-methyl-5-hydroxy-6-metoxy-1,4-benzoquinol methylase